MNRSILALIAAVSVLVVLGVGALATESHPVNACLVQLHAPLEPNVVSAQDCAYNAPDGAPFEDMRRSGYPLLIVLGSLFLVGSAMIVPIWKADNWTPAALRLLRYVTPGADLSPRD